MAKNTTEDFPIKNKCYYIVYFKDMLHAKISKYSFVSFPVAEMTLRCHIKRGERKHYMIVKGRELKKLQLKYICGFSLAICRKYLYPYGVSRAVRGYYVMSRKRQLKKLGLFTDVRVRYRVDKKVKVKIKGFGARTISKGYLKVFRLARYPLNIWFIPYNRFASSDPKLICLFDCLKIDFKKKEITNVRIKVYRREIIYAESGKQFGIYFLPIIKHTFNETSYNFLLKKIKAIKKGAI